jgi:hypothetical protein
LTELPLSVGDEFVYLMSDLNISEVPFLGDLSMGNTFTVTGTDELFQNGQSHEVFVIDITGEVEGDITNVLNTYDISSTRWLRKSDFAEVKNEAEISGSGSLFGLSFSMYFFTETTFDPPLDRFDFPITVGEKWVSASDTSTYFIQDISVPIVDDIYEENTTTSAVISFYEALHVEDVTVPAGTFETFVIWSLSGVSNGSDIDEATGYEWGDYTLEYYSSDLGFPVKIEYYNSNREMQWSLELQSYRKRTDIGGQDVNPQGGFQLPIWILYIFILVIILIIISILVVRRHREKAFIKDYLKGIETDGGGQTETPVIAQEPPPAPVVAPIESKANSQEQFEMQDISCPKCNTVFKVRRIKGWAMTVYCPYCGTRGKII